MDRTSRPKSHTPTTALLRIVTVGLVSTSAMTLVMELLYQLLPRHEQFPLPPEEIATVVEVKTLQRQLDYPQHMALTWISHYGYGIVLAAVYARIANSLSFASALKGILYGLSIWAASYLGWLPALRILRPATQFAPRRNVLMIIAHVVWGAALGLLTNRYQAE